MFWYILTLKAVPNGRLHCKRQFKLFFVNKIIYISIRILLNFVARGTKWQRCAFEKGMAWRLTCDIPLHELVMTSLLPHRCASLTLVNRMKSHTVSVVYKKFSRTCHLQLNCGAPIMQSIFFARICKQEPSQSVKIHHLISLLYCRSLCHICTVNREATDVK